MIYLDKDIFFNIINKFNKFMDIYDLIRIYFNITDKIFPNYIHKKSNKNVFLRLYSQRKISKNSCCTHHYSLNNYQYLILQNIITDYEHKIYLKANSFFLLLINKVIDKLKYIDIKKYEEKKNKFNNYIKSNILFWNWLDKNIILNRKGIIKKIL